MHPLDFVTSFYGDNFRPLVLVVEKKSLNSIKELPLSNLPYEKHLLGISSPSSFITSMGDLLLKITS